MQTFTTQEGAIFDWAYAECPRYCIKAKPEHYHFTSMTSYLCPHCGLMYDEPAFDNPADAFVGMEGDN